MSSEHIAVVVPSPMNGSTIKSCGKLIDPYFSWKKGDHISQRWGMDVNFPKYADYKLFCGDAEKMALQIKEMRDQGKGDLVKSSRFLPPVYSGMFEE